MENLFSKNLPKAADKSEHSEKLILLQKPEGFDFELERMRSFQIE